MHIRSSRPVLKAAAIGACAALAIGVPAQGHIEVPDGGAVQRDSISVITFRVHDGCDGGITDMVEITIPESVQVVQPESVPGWVVTVETEPVIVDGDEASDGEERISSVRWSGGQLPDDQYADFGLRALFPDVEGEIAFPARQGCGLTETIWAGDPDAPDGPPRVIVGPAINVGEEVEMAQELDTLRADVTALQEELTGVDPRTVRNRVADIEERLPNFVERMSRLGDRITELENALEEAEPTQ